MAKDKIDDYKAAIEDYTICILLNPESGKAHFNRAFSKSKVKDMLGALGDYEKCTAINPRHFAGYFNHGIILKDQNKHEAALADFDHALDINPSFTDARQNRAISGPHWAVKTRWMISIKSYSSIRKIPKLITTAHCISSITSKPEITAATSKWRVNSGFQGQVN